MATDTVTYGETEEKVGEQMKYLSGKAKTAKNQAAGAAMIVRGVAMPKGNYVPAKAYLIEFRCTG